MLVDDLDAGLDVVDAYAAEHLEIQTARRGRGRRPGAQRRRDLRRRRGRRSRSATTAPGSNHVLPTGGCACHTGGLSVQTFLRGIHVVDYTEAALRRRRARTSSRSAGAEDLPAHGAAVRARFPRDAGMTGPVGMTELDACRCATTCAGQTPVRRAAARRRRSG